MPHHVRGSRLLTGLIAILSGLAGCALMTSGGGSQNAALPAAATAEIPIGRGPILLAINGDGTRLYAAANNGLHVIDTGQRQVVASLSTPANAAGLTLSPDGRRGFVSNLFSAHLAVVDTSGPTLESPIDLLGGPTRPAYGRIAASRDGATAYVLDTVGQRLLAVDVQQRSLSPYQLGMTPRDIALSPDGRWAYICGCKNFCTPGNVQTFDTQQSTFGTELEVGPNPYRIVFSPDGKTVYTSNLGDGSVSVVDVETRSVTSTIQVDPQLTDLTVSRDGKWLFAVSQAAGQLAVVDLGTQEVSKTNIGPEPREVVLSPDGKRAYVSTASSVVIVETASLLAGS